MAILLICNHEFGSQLRPKQCKKLVHMVIEAVALGLCPKTRVRLVERIEVTSVFLVQTANERVSVTR